VTKLIILCRVTKTIACVLLLCFCFRKHVTMKILRLCNDFISFRSSNDIGR